MHNKYLRIYLNSILDTSLRKITNPIMHACDVTDFSTKFGQFRIQNCIQHAFMDQCKAVTVFCLLEETLEKKNLHIRKLIPQIFLKIDKSPISDNFKDLNFFSVLNLWLL